MQTKTNTRRRSSITLGMTDYERLSNLAFSVAERIPGGCDALLSELGRAVLVGDRSVRANIVRMGSVVAYEADTGDARTVTLVFPGDADISQGKVSVLTPVGTALLGLSEGQSFTWTGRDGRVHQLTVVSVESGPSARSVPNALMADA